jgi:hypothetical protein
MTSAHGGRSSAGRALGCGPRCRGFEPRRSPQVLDPSMIDDVERNTAHDL